MDLSIHHGEVSALVTPFHSLSLAKFVLLPLLKVKMRETYDSGKKSDKYLNKLFNDVLLSNCSNSNHIGEILTCLVSSTKAEDSFW